MINFPMEQIVVRILITLQYLKIGHRLEDLN